MKNNIKGITLIALIITIIILLILAVVTIGSIKNSNIITYAQNAVIDYEAKKDEEESLIADYESLVEKEFLEASKEPISKTISYIGYYADIDGNGIVDGIIYADLAFDDSRQWGNENGDYSYTKKGILNNYYISKKSYKYKNFESNPVIAPIDKVEENDRFYVMALTDFNSGTQYSWYYSANSNEGEMKDTSGLFGKGKENTNKMIDVWKNSKYGTGDTGTRKDIWGQIDTQVSEGWFIPSRGEWASFGIFVAEEGLEASASAYGLKDMYWSSTQDRAMNKNALCTNFHSGSMGFSTISSTCFVRLSTTF